MRRKFFLLVMLVFYSFVLRWKNPIKALLEPSLEVTQIQNHQPHGTKAFLASYVSDRQEDSNKLTNPQKEKHPILTVPTVPLLPQFIVSYKQAIVISSYNTCD